MLRLHDFCLRALVATWRAASRLGELLLRTLKRCDSFPACFSSDVACRVALRRAASRLGELPFASILHEDRRFRALALKLRIGEVRILHAPIEPER